VSSVQNYSQTEDIHCDDLRVLKMTVMEICSKYDWFSDLWTSRGTWLWLHAVQLLLTFSPSEDAFWERKADRDLPGPFLT